MLLLQKELSKLKPGKYFDDKVRGLFLLVKPNGRRTWVVRLTVNDRRQELGLGSLQDTPLSIAREKAIEVRQRRNAGEPLRASPRGSNFTLGRIYEEVLTQRRAGWKSPRSEAQWRSSFEQHCSRLRSRDVATISSKDILDVVTPLWHSKTETANRVLSRLDIAIKYARATGLYLRPEDPCDLARSSLPKLKREKGHMAAVEVEEAPSIFKHITALDSPSAWALAFCILTAARSGEVRKMKAEELDIEKAVWSVPADNMKAGKLHLVPLSRLALKMAQRGLALNHEVVFPNRSGKALSDAALLECLKGIKGGVTVHGWRSTFMGWATKKGYSRELTDKALAHQDANKVRAAYQRNNLLQEREPMMHAWQEYLAN